MRPPPQPHICTDVRVGQVLGRLQPRTPQLLEPPQLPAQPPRRVDPQRRVGPGQPVKDNLHRRQPGPPVRDRPFLVAHRPPQPAQLHQRRRREHLHRPPPGSSSRVARHGHVRPPRPAHQLHRPHPPPEQRQVRRVGPGPQPSVPPLQLPLTPPPGPRRVGHHQRRVQRHHRPTRVVPLEEPHQLLVGGRPPLGDDGPVRVEHGQPRRPPPTPRQVDPHEPHGADATRPRSGCGRLVWLGRGRLRRGRGGRARRRGCGARRRRRRR